MCNTKNRIWYHPDLIGYARELRNNPNKAEYILWQSLKGKQVKAYDFHRQKPLLFYIVDFYCPKLKLAIEVDGSIHIKEDRIIHDIIRSDELSDYGVKILRFSNEEVLSDVKKVIEEIKEWISNKDVPPTGFEKDTPPRGSLRNRTDHAKFAKRKNAKTAKC